MSAADAEAQQQIQETNGGSKFDVPEIELIIKVRKIYTYMHTYIMLCIHTVSMCVCVCVGFPFRFAQISMQSENAVEAKANKASAPQQQ